MIQFKLEAEMLNPVSNYFKNAGYRKQMSELQFYDYSIDLYAYSSKNQVTLAIELKLTHWKRAVEQALIYQLCSDLVYIALPETTIKKVDLSVLEMEGIGLIAVYPNRCREILEAKPSRVLKTNYKESNLIRIEEFQNA